MKALCVLLALMASTARAEGDAGIPFTLFDDYNCVSAPPMQQVDGGWLASDQRKARIDCALAGAQGELNDWRPGKAAVLPAPTGFVLLPSHGVLALLSSAVTAYLAVVTSRASKGCKAVLNPLGGC